MKMPRRHKVAGFPKFDAAKYKHGRIKALDVCAIELLQMADRIWDITGTLDTAVRDSICEGIAYLVHAAYDSQASSLGLDGAAFSAFVDTSTAEWFRERGCAEWFCLGAGALFHVSRPRTLAELKSFIKFKRSPGRKKKDTAA